MDPDRLAKSALYKFEDAVAAFSARRFSSAVHCAIHAIEEAMRWHEVRWVASPDTKIVTGKSKGSSAHQLRADKAADYLYQAEVSAMAMRSAVDYPMHLSADDPLEAKRARVRACLATLAHQGKLIELDEIEQQAIVAQSFIKLEMRPTRERANYAQENSSPVDVSEEQACLWIRIAKRILEGLGIMTPINPEAGSYSSRCGSAL